MTILPFSPYVIAPTLENQVITPQLLGESLRSAITTVTAASNLAATTTTTSVHHVCCLVPQTLSHVDECVPPILAGLRQFWHSRLPDFPTSATIPNCPFPTT